MQQKNVNEKSMQKQVVNIEEEQNPDEQEEIENKSLEIQIAEN